MVFHFRVNEDTRTGRASCSHTAVVVPKAAPSLPSMTQRRLFFFFFVLSAKSKHLNAFSLTALHEHGQGVVDIEPKDVHTNILVVRTKRNLTGEQFCKRFAQASFLFSIGLQSLARISTDPLSKTRNVQL